MSGFPNAQPSSYNPSIAAAFGPEPNRIPFLNTKSTPVDRSAYLPPAFSEDDDEDEKAVPYFSPVKSVPTNTDQDKMRVTRSSAGGAAPSSPQDEISAGEGSGFGRRVPPIRVRKPRADDDEPGERPARRSTRAYNHNDEEEYDANGDEDAEGEEDEEDLEGEEEGEAEERKPVRLTRSGRPTKSYAEDEDDEESDGPIKPRGRGTRSSGRPSRTSAVMQDFVVDDEDEDAETDYASRSKGRKLRGASSGSRVAALAKRRKTTRRGSAESAPAIETDEDGEEGHDQDGTDADLPPSQRNYRLRQRKEVNYSLAAPPPSPPRDGFGRIVRGPRGSKSGGVSGGAFEIEGLGNGTSRGRNGKTGWDALPHSMSGKDYARAFGEEPDTSDDDIPAARKAGGALGSSAAGGGLLGAGGVGAGSAAAVMGGPGGALGANRDAVGRMKGGAEFADADPLGVDMKVDFNAVGGLDAHVQQLKEMVSLPLLYPEVFQRFKVTPPRGVLFHGPPGTGKTLVARALAASCSSSGQPISFFMRKGADCLSKWVGEAERQLRLLFEEARASQPSIIFFDEIDGLAPVRSSKQDQIHASIVSTLLALMDGMDGRGQVVVIGATNRPDSVDPALRRPGRFDREFYFGLPNREARRAIIDIHTKEWNPPLDTAFKDRLAEVTKGYGGADLRALCTEAALNAIQRRYPQIYQTTERLLLDPQTIHVDAKDFMMSVNKIVPSSARSASSAAQPLPEHLKPLLEHTVQRAVRALQKVLPPAAKRNPLEEALWEDDVQSGSSVPDGGFGREMLLQSFEAMRVFRPRLLIHGQNGMGQGITGAALLHHLEGYHVQSLDIASLLGDSARTPEAAIVQLFVEAKRHKPSVIFIPGLAQWATSSSDSVRSTVKALLDGLSPADPVLLLAVAEEPVELLPRDVRSWFGYLDDNKVQIEAPGVEARRMYFNDVFEHAMRPPNEFPDALPRRKRQLEKLPIAPPRKPRELTVAELEQQKADDQRLLEHLKHRLGLVLVDLRKKHKRFTRDVWDEYNLRALTEQFDYRKEKGKVIVTILYDETSISTRRRRRSSVDVTGAERFGEAAKDIARGDEMQQDSDHVVSTSHAEIAAQPPPNGDVSMSDVDTAPEQAAMQASGAVQITAGETNGTVLTNGHAPEEAKHRGHDLNVPGLPGLRHSSQAGYYERDLVLWTLTLEKMQKRLYHNGYLTVDQFVEDLGKIVWNAEMAQEVDQERLVRAHQCRNEAIIRLDAIIEPAFKAEVEGMAARTLKREQEEAKQTAKAAATASDNAAADAPRRPSGERFSARQQGKAPEIRLVDVLALERDGKRSRRSSSRVPSGAGDEAARKRLKQEADEQLAGQGYRSAPASQASSDAPIVQSTLVAAGGAQAQQVLGFDRRPVPTTMHASISSSISSPGPSSGIATPTRAQALPSVPATGEPQHLNDAMTILEAPSPQPAPVAHPPFKISHHDMSNLASQVLALTHDFTIEQLEQLRAACFDAVWRHRSEWDRSTLVQELRDLVQQIAAAVATDKRERQLEAAALQAL
ncbi:aaa-domain-containing protein [Ceraceosorus bombacis]|uniref:Aaa-domain-containing protein n=1 Tax=Ceraceosorus bombacis TaxID=401625 RepID=A0A0P1BF50_9BASI|nr:aaa-domain-containing protein [Ceraceosorus bombacis]